MEKELYDRIIVDYKNGIDFEELSQKYGYSDKYIKEKLAKDNYYKPEKYKRFTNEEIEIIKEYYQKDEMDKLFQLIPEHTPESIILKAKKIALENKIEDPVEYLKELIKDKPYKMIDGTYNPENESFSAITEDGYKVVIYKTTLNKKNIPDYFNTKNPYTLENIHNYIKLNNIEVELLSTEYEGKGAKMLWRCKCGEIFSISWKQFLRGKHTCDKCSKEIARSKISMTIDYVKEKLSDGGFTLIDYDESKPISHQKIIVQDQDGYMYELFWPHYNKGTNPYRYARFNKFTIQNINKYFRDTGRSDYMCISKEYKDNSTPLDILHIPCGTIFQMTLINIQEKPIEGSENKRYKECPNCFPKRVESFHASVLKQIFLHEYPDTIPEEKSCVNPNTGLPLPTDIVNHSLKIAIEIQSQHHDNEGQKVKDAIKKQYWIDKGYNFYDPDIRDYSVIGMVQLFFPNIDKIPDYINYNYSDCANVELVQQYLDQGYTIGKTAEALGIKYHIISGMIQDGRVIKPDDYKRRPKNSKPVVQLDLDGNYVSTYSCCYETRKFGFCQNSVNKVLHGKSESYQSYYWLYEEDYLSGNYSLLFTVK